MRGKSFLFEKCSARITLTVVGLSRCAAVWQARDAQRWIWQNFQLRAKREKLRFARKTSLQTKRTSAIIAPVFGAGTFFWIRGFQCFDEIYQKR